MFCPICKLEYRAGFTHCNDCDVPLVASLSDVPVHTNAPQNPDAAEVLWTGTDSAISTAIAEALDAAEISYHEHVRQVGLLPGMTQPVYLIMIHARDHNAAQTALENARLALTGPQAGSDSFASDLDRDAGAVNPLNFGRRVYNRVPTEGDASTEGGDDDSGESDEPIPDDIIEDFDPDEATAAVWSGANADMRNVLISCLRENGIGCAVDDSGAEHHILVMPSSEKRAKEIIREVVEASPPE